MDHVEALYAATQNAAVRCPSVARGFVLDRRLVRRNMDTGRAESSYPHWPLHDRYAQTEKSSVYFGYSTQLGSCIATTRRLSPEVQDTRPHRSFPVFCGEMESLHSSKKSSQCSIRIDATLAPHSRPERSRAETLPFGMFDASMEACLSR